MRTKNPNKKSIFTCIICGKKFEEWIYRNPKCCSRKCASKMSIGHPKPTKQKPEIHITKTCIICSKNYRTTTHQERFRGSNYCSRKCMGIGASRRMKGANNPNYVDGKGHEYGDNWIAQSREARKRDNYTCQLCNYKYNKTKRVDVHHIIPFRVFGIENYKSANHLTNLIVLCRTCHKKIEKTTRAILEIGPSWLDYQLSQKSIGNYIHDNATCQ